MTLQLLNPSLDVRLLAIMLDDGAFDPAADWLTENVPEPADVLLLYARDRGACEGLEMKCRCPACMAVGGRTRVGQSVSSPIRCESCGFEGPDAVFGYHPEQILPTDFPQAALAAWAGCVYGAGRRKEVMAKSLWSVVQPIGGAGNPELYPVARRERKRRTLRLFPEVERVVEHRGKTIQTRNIYGDSFDPEWYGVTPVDVELREVHITLDGQTFVATKDRAIKTRQDGDWFVVGETLRAEDFVPAEPDGVYGISPVVAAFRRLASEARREAGWPPFPFV